MIDAYKRCRDYLDAAIGLIRPSDDGRNRLCLAACAGV
jgi:hypothetical protein